MNLKTIGLRQSRIPLVWLLVLLVRRRRILLWRGVRVVRMVIINRELPRRTLQFDRDLGFGLRNFVVLAVGLESMRQNLHAQRPVRDSVEIALPLRAGF